MKIHYKNAFLGTDENSENIKNEAVPIFSMFHSNQASLSDTLDDVSSNVNNTSDFGLAEAKAEDDDDCVIMGSNVPIPLNSTTEGLTKRDDDPISHDIPFIITVRIC